LCVRKTFLDRRSAAAARVWRPVAQRSGKVERRCHNLDALDPFCECSAHLHLHLQMQRKLGHHELIRPPSIVPVGIPVSIIPPTWANSRSFREMRRTPAFPSGKFRLCPRHGLTTSLVRRWSNPASKFRLCPRHGLILLSVKSCGERRKIPIMPPTCATAVALKT
jgi:hypothetical protein